MRTGIIYRAFNRINGKSYIGQTVQNLKKRIKGHYSKSKKYNYKFSNALKKYDKKDWIWTILIETETYKLDYYEKLFIKEFGSLEYGYNSTEGGSIKSGENLGENNHKYCNKIHHLYHKDFGELHLTISELTKLNENLSKMNKLLSGEYKQINGFVLFENKDKYEDFVIGNTYKFFNEQYGAVEGRLYPLTCEFNLHKSFFEDLINKRLNYKKGWILFENFEKYNELKNIDLNKNKFKFFHKEHGNEFCSRLELCKKYNLNHKSVCCLVKGSNKSLFGWTIIKD